MRLGDFTFPSYFIDFESPLWLYWHTVQLPTHLTQRTATLKKKMNFKMCQKLDNLDLRNNLNMFICYTYIMKQNREKKAWTSFLNPFIHQSALCFIRVSPWRPLKEKDMTQRKIGADISNQISSVHQNRIYQICNVSPPRKMSSDAV